MRFLKVALRNIRKHKVVSVINIVGLAIGFACSILVFLFVRHEFSFDKYHEKADRIHRVAINASIGDARLNQTRSSAKVFRKLLAEFPEIETGVKIMPLGTRLVQYDETSFFESGIFAADSTFFDVFTLPLIHGSAGRALSEPNTVVLTERAALKYFGRTDVIGEMLTVQFAEPRQAEITGVAENVPENTHFRFDFLVSSTSFPGSINSTSWTDNRFISYVVLREDLGEIQLSALNEKLRTLDRKYNDRDGSYDDWLAKGNSWEFFLQPITSIHLDSDLDGEFEANGSRSYVYMFLAIGLAILLIACVNFMNLSTARASLRSREVGIRKVVGSDRKRLIGQFLGESILQGLIALGLGLILVESLRPHFGGLVGRSLEFDYVGSIITIPALLLLGVTAGVISGAYPAFVLSSYRPAMLLKYGTSSGQSSARFRNALIVFQFSIAILLIVSTLTIDRQLKFMQEKDIGFDREQVMIINNPGALTRNLGAFKQTLKNRSDINGVTGSSSIPGGQFPNVGFREEGSDDWVTLNTFVCDYDFLETLKLQMATGRFFSPEFGSDSSGIILNEAACDLLGWDDPIGRRLGDGWNYGTYSVIGVVGNLHYESLHQTVRPMALLLSGGPFIRSENYIAVRIGVGKVSATIASIEKVWNRFAPGVPFRYSFLDEDYDNLYMTEQQARRLSTILCGLALFISCIGLFGLASFVADQKCREIGIRRVLGASIPGIVGRLNWTFLTWVMAANIIAWPVAWVMMNRWLENFAYRVDLDIRTFLASGVMAMIIALVTVSWQSIRAATANPIDTLRSE